MKRLLLLCAVAMLTSCGKSDLAKVPKQVAAGDLEAMLVVAGQEHMATIGTQHNEGPYEFWGSFSGGSGGGVSFGGLHYDFPKDGRSYIARCFRNPDGSHFMKVSRHPEGAGTVKNQNGEQAAGGNGGQAR